MKRFLLSLPVSLFFLVTSATVIAQQGSNPIIYADVPDMSIIRQGNTYYMSSTTMHMNPGLPIMKSNDLVNWQLVNYAYDTLSTIDAFKLTNGKSTYGHGSWASSLRYHNGTYYVSTFANPPGKTYIYSTKDIEKGPWKAQSFSPALHDHSLFFEEDGRVYMVYGNGRIMITELESDLSGIKPGTSRVLIENASAPAGNNIGLPAEGSQLFKINNKYYLFNITWPKGGMRTVVIHRADSLTGPYEGRLALQDKGVAQGGLINTPEGNWFAYLFRDFGAVGRIPYLVPVTWENDWPILGVNGKVTDSLPLPVSTGYQPGIVCSDEFDRSPRANTLPLPWQWNHNPDNNNWSLTKRSGYLRLTTSRIDTSLVMVRNMLTQRTFGPECAAVTALDTRHMKEGDCAGLTLFQKIYGWVGVKAGAKGNHRLVMVNTANGIPEEVASIPIHQPVVYLKAAADFRNRADKGYFYYSLDGNTWTAIGTPLPMAYTIPHFMGYRLGLFNYATQTTGGYADFDYYRLDNTISGNTGN
ncbi:glycoside hydrolase family 43 protein [Filimonas lacunae]|nr:glycoside hydrolase 43 family protein [Filimonas lacunae]